MVELIVDNDKVSVKLRQDDKYPIQEEIVGGVVQLLLEFKKAASANNSKEAVEEACEDMIRMIDDMVSFYSNPNNCNQESGILS